MLFHHEPDHDDDFMDKLEADAQAEWPDTLAARENSEIVVLD